MSSDDEDDEDLFDAASMAARKKQSSHNGGAVKSTNTTARKGTIGERKTPIEATVSPQTLIHGSIWTVSEGNAFEAVKSAFIKQAQREYGAQVGTTHKIAASGGRNALKINCFLDDKQAVREKCNCPFCNGTTV